MGRSQRIHELFRQLCPDDQRTLFDVGEALLLNVPIALVQVDGRVVVMGGIPDRDRLLSDPPAVLEMRNLRTLLEHIASGGGAKVDFLAPIGDASAHPAPEAMQ